jgi:hypothetical protein
MNHCETITWRRGYTKERMRVEYGVRGRETASEVECSIPLWITEYSHSDYGVQEESI